jgi:hypothetical protein
MKKIISIVSHARFGECLHMFAQHMCIINSNGFVMNYAKLGVQIKAQVKENI